MGWLRKFLGIEENIHTDLNDGFPAENRHQDRLFMDEDDDLPAHFSMSESPFQWRGRGSTVIDPFEELEKMMQDSFIGSGAIFGGPNLNHGDIIAPPSRSASPRDQLLKQPDSDIIPNSHNDIRSGSLPSSELETNEHHHSLQPFNPGVHEGQSLFSILDSLMESFVRIESFSRSSHLHRDNFPNEQPAMSPRDAMIKTDTDLDEQTESSGIDHLLSEHSPSYSYSSESSPPVSPFWGPGGDSGDQGCYSSPSIPSNDQHVHRSFTSTSIRRIVRPDGSVEERRTYRDSSGKEEVTVTEMDPSTAGPLLARDDFFGSGGSGSLLGSIFRKLF